MSKLRKKNEKKRCKMEEMLWRDEQIHCVKDPTEFVMVANGGLGNGVSREALFERFSVFGLIREIQMKPRRSYSLLHFVNVDDAKNAFSKFDESNIFNDENGGEIHLTLAFIENMPLLEEKQNKCYPKGLQIITDFVSEDDEKNFLQCCDWGPEDLIPLKNRRVKHFGYEFNYKMKTANKINNLMPPFCSEILNKLKTQGYISEDMDQLTVNQYTPGQGIPNHVDTFEAFENEILIISLGSQIVMDFKHPNGNHAPIVLPKCSAAVLKDESRYIWSHGIAPRLYDLMETENGLTLVKRSTRVSFTFRKVKTKSLDIEKNGKEIKEENAISERNVLFLEENYVYKVYDQIAQHFSKTRHSPWASVVNFLNGLKQYSIVLDVGCGNGKYLGIRKSELYMIGCDVSASLCKIGSLINEVQICNVVSLPYRDNKFDACICIAVLHHLASEERRILALKEISRVMKTGGKALIYVWAMEQDFTGSKSKYIQSNKESDEIQGFHKVGDDLCLPVHKSKTSFKFNDNLVPWRCQTDNISNEESANVYQRYYHVFSEGELEGLCKKIDPLIKVSNVFYEEGNWCVELYKTANSTNFESS